MEKNRKAEEEGREMVSFEPEKLAWVNEPAEYVIGGSEIRIRTEPGTDLWQRTYYHFRNDKIGRAHV